MNILKIVQVIIKTPMLGFPEGFLTEFYKGYKTGCCKWLEEGP